MAAVIAVAAVAFSSMRLQLRSSTVSALSRPNLFTDCAKYLVCDGIVLLDQPTTWYSNTELLLMWYCSLCCYDKIYGRQRSWWVWPDRCVRSYSGNALTYEGSDIILLVSILFYKCLGRTHVYIVFITLVELLMVICRGYHNIISKLGICSHLCVLREAGIRRYIGFCPTRFPASLPCSLRGCAGCIHFW